MRRMCRGLPSFWGNWGRVHCARFQDKKDAGIDNQETDAISWRRWRRKRKENCKGTLRMHPMRSLLVCLPLQLRLGFPMGNCQRKCFWNRLWTGPAQRDDRSCGGRKQYFQEATRKAQRLDKRVGRSHKGKSRHDLLRWLPDVLQRTIEACSESYGCCLECCWRELDNSERRSVLWGATEIFRRYQRLGGADGGQHKGNRVNGGKEDSIQLPRLPPHVLARILQSSRW